MGFKAEDIKKIEEEDSLFLHNRVGDLLRSGYPNGLSWVVDRERKMVLYHEGGGRSWESHGEDCWSFFDENSAYWFYTKTIEQKQLSSHEIFIKRSFSYSCFKAKDYEYSAPNKVAIAGFKDALREYKDFGVASRYSSCDLVLIFEKMEWMSNHVNDERGFRST